MSDSRISNISSRSRGRKPQPIQKMTITSAQYLDICKNSEERVNQLVYDSLHHYEKHICFLKASVLIGEIKQEQYRKKKSFHEMFEYSKKIPVAIEPLTEDEQETVKPSYFSSKINECRQIAEILEVKNENEKESQQQFINTLTAQLYEDQIQQLEAVFMIERILNRKTFATQSLSFAEVKKKAFPERPSDRTIKNVLTSSFMMLQVKMKEAKQVTFKTFLRQFGLDSIVKQLDANNKLKGRALMSLKEYPRLNLKRAFWRWYLSSTDKGDELFQIACDKMVLYTNINKTTFFYRLWNQVKGREIKVNPKIKRTTVMVYLYSKLFFERPMREFFEKLKIKSQKVEETGNVCTEIVKCAKIRQKEAIKMWAKSVQKFKQQEEEKNKKLLQIADQMLKVSKDKKKYVLQEWRKRANKKEKEKQIKEMLLKKIMQTKVWKFKHAYDKMKSIPVKSNKEGLKKANKFEKGLLSFAQSTMRKTMAPFKNEYEEGQAEKKRAVIQLISCTQGGQKKLFNRWKTLTEKSKLMVECKMMNSLFQTLHFVLKSNADLAFIENKETVLKERALIQLFKNLEGNQSSTLKRWREFNSIEKIKSSVNQKQKEMLLRVLNDLLEHGKTNQIRQAILKFRTNRRVTEIQRNFLKRLLMSKAGLVVIAFRKMQSLPMIKNPELLKKANKFEKGLLSFAQSTMRKTMAPFKNEYEEGQAEKKRAVIQLISCTQGGQKKLFNRWKTLTEKSKLMVECKMMNSLFQTLHFVLKSNADLAFIENKETVLKERALIQLFKNLEGNQSSTLKRWREFNSIEKIKSSVNQKQKEMLLRVLNDLLEHGKTNQIRQAILKFRTNRRVTEIQRNFLKRLLMSKAGLVVIAFRKMQSLPMIKNPELLKKANKFEKGLLSFAQSTMRKTMAPFKNEYEEGQAEKKRAVIQLISCTQGGQKKLFNRWKTLTEKSKLMVECKMMNSLFQTLHFVLKSNADLAFIENKETVLKERALIQLFKNLEGNQSSTLKRWREFNSIEKIKSSVNQKQKEMLLRVLNDLLEHGKTNQIRQAILKFRTNRRVTEIQRNFLKRLLMSKAGLVVIAFRKMQSLPMIKNPELLKKANKFEKGLLSFAQSTMRKTMAPFKNEYEEGQAEKKRAVIQLISCTQGGQKKLFNRWKTLTEKSKLMVECKMMNSLFQTLHFVLKSNADLAFIENKETVLKERALIQLFKNLEGNQSSTLKRWREFNSIEKIKSSVNQKQKEMLLRVLNDLLEHGKTNQIRQAILKFRTNRRVTEIQRNFLKRLLMSKAGLVVIAFRKMQSLPMIKNPELLKKANKFEKGLLSFAQSTMRKTMAPFKNEYEEGQAEKKRAVIQLISCTQGGQKKLFNRWKTLTEKSKLMVECKMMNSLFQTLHFVLKSNADLAFIENKETVLKERALIQLFKNLEGNQSSTLKRWREFNSIEKIKSSVNQKQKEMLLRVLNDLLEHGKTNQIRQAILKFRTNRRVTEIQRNFLKRLLMSKAGLVVIAFRKMQSLPMIKNPELLKKANKFEKGLLSFAQSTMRKTMAPFKNEYEEGQAEKKRAVIQLISCTQGGQKKLFNRWKTLTEKSKLMVECKMMNSLFQTLHFVLKSNADLAFIENKETVLKERALIQLFKNLEGNQSSTLKRWREFNSIEKIKSSVNQKQKEMLLRVLNDLLEHGKTNQIRQAILKFRTNRRVTEIQRNFLKRLLMSKAGLVVIAFRKMQSLPMIKNPELLKKANKFEKGLLSFAQSTMRKTMAPFKNEYEEGQAEKKRAVIQLISCTQGGQKKLFNRWKTLTEKSKLMVECKMMNSLFQTLHFVLKSNADLAFIENKETVLKERALIQLFKNLEGNQSSTLKRWREFNSIEKIKSSVNQKQKEMLLRVLNDLLEHGKTNQIRQAILKFRTNRRVTEIQRNFLKRLLMSKAGLVVIAFRKMQSLPMIKNPELLKKANKFEKGLLSFAQSTMRKTMAPFKNEYEEGQAEKKRAVIQLISCTQGGQKKLFNRWKTLTEKSKLMVECKMMNSLFQTLHFVLKSNADLAFIENKETVLKERALIQLFKNLEGNQSSTLKRWREFNSIEKIKSSVNQKQKEMLLRVLNDLLEHGKTNQIRQAILKFRTNRRVTEIQRNFLKRLLMSKAGLVVIAFRKMQSLPMIKNPELLKKANKFEKGLLSFAQSTMRKTMAPFKNEYEEGQAEKKRAVIQLISCTQGGQKKLFNRWKTLTEKSKLMVECKMMNSLFQTLHFVLKSNADLAFIENKETVLKERALIQLFKNLEGNQSSTLKRWREFNSIEKIKSSVNQKQKEMLLRVLNDLLEHGKTNQIRQAILKFRTNRRVTEIQRNFLKRLLMSKAGLVVIAFRKMQSLPMIKNPELLKKANKFEKGLLSFAQSTMRKTMAPFKNEYEEGQAEKKRAVIQLISCTQGGQKKLFNRWKTLTEKSKLMVECKMMNSLFQTLHFVLKSNADLAFIENKETVLKERALIQLFKNLEGNQSSTLKRWREFNSIEKIKSSVNQKQKEMLLRVLNDLLEHGKTNQIRQAILKFRTNRRVTEIQRNFLKRLLMSKAGLVVIAFRKMQSLPMIKNPELLKKANKFEKGLLSFAQSTMRKTMAPFKNEYEEGQAEKKRAVIQLISCTQGGQKKLFNRWKTLTEKSKLMVECKMMNSLFQTLHFVLKSNADLAFIENKETVLKERALIQLFKNLEGNQSSTLKRWREFNSIEKIKSSVNQKQKEMLLRVLNDLLEHGKTNQIRQAILKFRTNRRVTEIQRNFLKRLLMSKAGLVVIAFRKMQSLPMIKNPELLKKANKFEKGLLSFAQSTMRKTMAPFKNEYEEGQAEKKRAVIQLISCTQGGQKKLFNRWKTLTEKSKLMVECKMMNSLFQTLHFVLKSNADLAFIENKETVLKERALIQLFKNLEGNQSSTLKRWREFNSIEKIKSSVNQKQKEMLLRVLNDLLEHGKTNQIRQAILKFRTNRRVTEIQRNFLKRLLMSKAGLVVIAFRKMQSLPMIKNPELLKKANKFEKGLLSFAQSTMRKTMAPFKNEYEEGQAEKKRAVIQLISCTQGGQKKLFNRWKTLTAYDLLYRRCKAIQTSFSHLSSSLVNNLKPLFRTRQYNLHGITNLHNFFSKVSQNTNNSIRQSLKLLSKHAHQTKTNRWFKKSAQHLALRTRVSMQKSFWRLRYNMQTNGITHFDANYSVKLKKMFNNIRKYYELTMFRAFLMIEKYGRRVPTQNSIYNGRNTSHLAPKNNYQNQYENVVQVSQQNFSYEESAYSEFSHQTTQILTQKADEAYLTNKLAAMNICENIFNRNALQHLRRWDFNVSQSSEKQIIHCHEFMAQEQPQKFEFITKLGGVERIAEIIRRSECRVQSSTFKTVSQFSLKVSSEALTDQNMGERIEFINQQNKLMEEIREYMEENEDLTRDLEMKSNYLKEANEAVTLLSLRINYMITQKFVSLVEKITDEIEFRNLNAAFDGIIEEANFNYENSPSFEEENEEILSDAKQVELRKNIH